MRPLPAPPRRRLRRRATPGQLAAGLAGPRDRLELQVDRSHARLRKTPARLTDTTRGARARAGRPALLAPALRAALPRPGRLEGEERQTALGAGRAHRRQCRRRRELAAAGVRFTLESRDERRDLVAVARLLLALGVLRRVDGDEAAYVTGPATRCTPSTAPRWPGCSPPAVPPPPSTRTTSTTSSPPSPRSRCPTPPTPATGPSATGSPAGCSTTPCSPTTSSTSRAGLPHLAARPHPRPRSRRPPGSSPRSAPRGSRCSTSAATTDLRMPEEGTDGHLTLLLAEHLADGPARTPGAGRAVAELEARTAELAIQHAAHWRKDATDPAATRRR
jgi:hypothetical protein